MKKVASLAIENISSNSRNIHNENRYNALDRIFKIGQRYNFYINESYYYDCKLVGDDFPGKLRTLIMNEPVIQLLKSIKIKGRQFNNKILNNVMLLANMEINYI